MDGESSEVTDPETTDADHRGKVIPGMAHMRTEADCVDQMLPAYSEAHDTLLQSKRFNVLLHYGNVERACTAGTDRAADDRTQTGLSHRPRLRLRTAQGCARMMMMGHHAHNGGRPKMPP